ISKTLTEIDDGGEGHRPKANFTHLPVIDDGRDLNLAEVLKQKRTSIDRGELLGMREYLGLLTV
ncbi:hypothetical protein HAX54_019823, partial [Datura stramonium]|nr:hypothetical protein [Datura stramonium]